MKLNFSSPVTLNLFQGLTYSAMLQSKMLKQVQHDGRALDAVG